MQVTSTLWKLSKGIWYSLGGIIAIGCIVYYGHWLYALSPVIISVLAVLIFAPLLTKQPILPSKHVGNVEICGIENYKAFFGYLRFFFLPLIIITTWLIVGYFFVFHQTPLKILELLGGSS